MAFEQFFNNTSEKKCVTINFNGEFDTGKVLHLESEWSLHEFLNAASNRLGVASLKRIFNSDGVDIDDCMMIEDNDMLFLSNGDDFIPLTTSENIEMTGGTSGVETINGTIAGFRIGKMLGRGGFGEVRIGEHHLTGELVALKFLRKAEIISMGAAERTTTEVQCLSALRHQHIIRLQQQLESPHHVVLVLELMEGGDLFNYLHARQEDAAASDGSLQSAFKYALPEDEARHVFSQIISAVGYAHNQHICHRDLKLENILLKTKTLQCVKVADFGLSAFYRPGAMMKSSCGTLSFLAPEVFAGTSNAGPPLDVWAMGVILFALLCGRLPFEGPDLRGTKRPRDAVIQSRISKGQYKIEESLSPEAKDLVRRLLRVDPAVRSSVPEIFSHVWLRSSQGGVTFESVRSVPAVPSSAGAGAGAAGAPPVFSTAPEEGNMVNGHLRGQVVSLMGTNVSPADVSTVISRGIDRIDSGNDLMLRRASDRDLVVHRGESRSRSRSRSCSRGGSEVGDDGGTSHRLDHLSDADILEALEFNDDMSLPLPTFEDVPQIINPSSARILSSLSADSQSIEDLANMLPPSPTPTRPGRFSMVGSRDNSFGSKFSDSKDSDDEKVGGGDDSSSPRTPPKAVSSFVLVPLRRRDLADAKTSPRRPRSSAGNRDHEEITRYQSSSDCFDYDINDNSHALESLSQHCDAKNKALLMSNSSIPSKHSRQSWTDQIDDQKEKDSKMSGGDGSDSPRSLHSKGGSAGAGAGSGSAGGGNGKFGSPTASRNKLHIAGSLSLKSHTITSSPISSARSRFNSASGINSPSNEKRGGAHDLDGRSMSSPLGSRDRSGHIRTSSRYNAPGSPDVLPPKGSGGGVPGGAGGQARSSTSYGRKVLRNPHAGGGGHAI